MSKLGLLLDVANIAVSANNAYKLGEMQRQGAEAAVIQAIITMLRDEIFKYKQTAEAILEVAKTDAKIAAGAMYLLQERLNDSGIRPEMFPELGDKDYALSTIRLINDNHKRLMNQLPQDDQIEINKLAATVAPLDDYEFYLMHFEDGRQLSEATENMNKYGTRNSCVVKLASLLYIYPGFMIPLVPGMIIDNAFGTILVVTFFAAYLYGGYLFFRWQGRKDYGQAKKVISKLKDKFDLERFEALDRQFNGRKQEVQQLKENAQKAIRSFFGETAHLLG